MPFGLGLGALTGAPLMSGSSGYSADRVPTDTGSRAAHGIGKGAALKNTALDLAGLPHRGKANSAPALLLSFGIRGAGCQQVAIAFLTVFVSRNLSRNLLSTKQLQSICRLKIESQDYIITLTMIINLICTIRPHIDDIAQDHTMNRISPTIVIIPFKHFFWNNFSNIILLFIF
jgi:hypothetical protein